MAVVVVPSAARIGAAERGLAIVNSKGKETTPQILKCAALNKLSTRSSHRFTLNTAHEAGGGKSHGDLLPVARCVEQGPKTLSSKVKKAFE